MTYDPSVTQTALLAVGEIREAWPYLEPAKDAALGRYRPPARPLTAAARAELDRLLRAEKAERIANQRAGLIPRVPTSAPTRLAVIDAEQLAATTVKELMWIGASTQLADFAGDAQVRDAATLDGVPRRPPILFGIYPQLDFIADLLDLGEDLVDERYATTANAELTATAAMLRNVLHLDESWIPVDRRCPACQRRSLRAYLGSPHVREWTIICRGDRPACLCDGRHCPCERPGRRPATRHVWSAPQLRHLGRITQKAA
jgi:hypothetical protein